MNDFIAIAGILIIVALMVLFNYKITQQNNHFRALSAFLHLRNKVAQDLFSFDNVRSLSQQEYESARFLLTMLNQIITYYNDHSTVMFNLRLMRRIVEKDMKHYQEVQQKVREKMLTFPDNTNIAKLYAEFAQISAAAFLLHTPFIRTEIILRLLWRDVAEQVAKAKQEQANSRFGDDQKFA